MSLEDLTKYQWARLAGENLESRERLPLAVAAMEKHYSGPMYDQSREDPIIGEALETAFKHAQEGLGDGHLTSRGLLRAIKHYSGKYEEAKNKATIEDIVKSAEEAGYEIPGESERLLEKYMSMTYSELKSKAEDAEEKEIEGRKVRVPKDKEAYLAFESVKAIESYKFGAELYRKLEKELTDRYLKDNAKKAKQLAAT